MIAAARAEATAAAERQIKIMIAALAERRIATRAACVPAGNSKLPNVLADILAAHSRIHAAEGVFYREALVEACVRLRLRVTRASERDLWPLSAKALVSTEDKLRTRLREMGKHLGPPWGEDQKVAALAACVGFAVPKPAG
jgi:hypothetical protein